MTTILKKKKIIFLFKKKKKKEWPALDGQATIEGMSVNLKWNTQTKQILAPLKTYMA